MSLNLKDNFKNINKKNIAIITAILFIITICSICGYEYYQYQRVHNIVYNQAANEPNLKGGLEEDTVNIREEVSTEEEKPLKPSEYNIGISYEEAKRSTKPVIVLFYADWCGYCIRFMPTYQKLSEIYKNDYDFAKVNVEDPKYEKDVREMGISGFPTVYLIDPKYDNKVLLSNSLFGNFESLKKETDRFLRIRNLLEKK